MEPILHKAHNELERTHWWFRGRRAILRTLLAKEISGRISSILDVGSGGGSMLPVLEELASRVDVLEPYAASAEKLSLTRGSVFCSRIEDFHPAQSYNAVTLFDVLEHLSYDEEVLAQLRGLLLPGGYLVLTVPAYQFLWSRHDVLNHHVRRYSASSLCKKVEAAGFRVERLTYFNTFLFPAVFGLRFLQRLVGSKGGEQSDFSRGSGFANGFLAVLFGGERLFLRFLNFPFGVSLFCLARKI